MDEHDPVDALVQTSFLVHAAVADAGAAHQLSLTQVRLLGVLRDRQPQMAQLAAHLRLDKSSATGLIDRAQRRGLVQRTPSATDGRSFTVSLTTAGRELAGTLEQQVTDAVGALLAGLTGPQRRQLAHLTTKIIQGAPSPVDERPTLP